MFQEYMNERYDPTKLSSFSKELARDYNKFVVVHTPRDEGAATHQHQHQHQHHGQLRVVLDYDVALVVCNRSTTASLSNLSPSIMAIWVFFTPFVAQESPTIPFP